VAQVADEPLVVERARRHPESELAARSFGGGARRGVTGRRIVPVDLPDALGINPAPLRLAACYDSCWTLPLRMGQQDLLALATGKQTKRDGTPETHAAQEVDSRLAGIYT
jgi:hypothetical protein